MLGKKNLLYLMYLLLGLFLIFLELLNVRILYFFFFIIDFVIGYLLLNIIFVFFDCNVIFDNFDVL